MNHGLVLLTRLQLRAVLRRAWRGVRRPKGAVFAIVGALVLTVWLGPTLFSLNMMKKSDPDAVRAITPMVLLLLSVVTLIGSGNGGKAADRAISFTPAEVNFLFPGPFTRRQLLLYKLARTGAGAVFTGLIFSIVLLQHAQRWPAAFAGGTLAMLFVQLLAVALILAGQAAGTRAYSLGRRVVLGLVLLAVVVVVLPVARDAYARGVAGGTVLEVAKSLHASPAARVVLAPFTPFGNLFAAGSWGAIAEWGAVAVAIDAALLLLILRLDADYREVAIAASERAMQRMERVRRGQVLQQMPATGAARRTRLGMFPWIGGAGPTAWRQLVTALRTSRGTLVVLLFIACAAFIPMFVSSKAAVAPILVAAGWGTIMLTGTLKFDFRGELDQLAWLKAMPLHPVPTALGQLLVPAAMLTLLQLILLGAAAWAAGGQREQTFILAAMPFLPPLNVLILGVENLTFLLFPSRPAGAAPGDLSAMGRQVVFVILKLLVIATVAGLAGGAGGIVWFLTKPSIVPAMVAAFAVVAIAAISVVPLVGLAYARFDPSMDTPA